MALQKTVVKKKTAPKKIKSKGTLGDRGKATDGRYNPLDPKRIAAILDTLAEPIPMSAAPCITAMHGSSW